MTDTTNFARRKLVTGLGLGAAAFGAATTARAQASAPHWQPAFDSQDDWMELPGRHRLVFDAISPRGAGEALGFAANYISCNKSGYGLGAKDLANIVILRHMASPFGYNDAMWAKYGPIMGTFLKYNDPKTKKPPTRNMLMTPNPKSPPGLVVSIPALVGDGVHFAICGAATHYIAGVLAEKTKAKPEAVEHELAANLIANAHMVPAGIVAVNRTQERGYAYAYVG